MNRTIATVMIGLAAVLAAIGILGGGDESGGGGEGGARGERSADERSGGGLPPIDRVADRVERLRELRFDRLPRVRLVDRDQARKDGLRELDRQVKPSEVLAEERLLKLLGLLPPDSSLRDELGKELSSEVGGYYVPGTDRLSIVRGQLGGMLADITLAHELTHALEDQRFGLESKGTTGFRRDRAVADGALREGTATVVMIDYLVLDQTGRVGVAPRLRGQVLEEIGEVAIPASSGLPRYLREGLVFPYVAGSRLINQIQGRGGWEAVDRAYGDRAPVSTEQVMHPEKYFAREEPARVRVPALRGALPGGARPIEQGAFGEWDTEQLLRGANGRERSTPAAAGWGGGAFRLWRLPGAACKEPCRDRYVLALRWTWDTERDAREFAAAAARSARTLGGAAARDGRVTALVLAPRGASALAERAAAP